MSTRGLNFTRALSPPQRPRVEQARGAGPRDRRAEERARQHRHDAEPGPGGQQRAIAERPSIGDPVGGAVLAGQAVHEEEGQQRVVANSATAQPRPRSRAEQGREEEQRAGGEGRLEGHPEPEGGPVGHVGDHPHGEAAGEDEARRHGGRGHDVLVEAPRGVEVGAHRRPGVAGRQSGRGGRPVRRSRSRPRPRPAPSRAAATGNDTPRRRSAGRGEVGGDGVDGQRPQPTTAVEQAAHAEHRREGHGQQQDLRREDERSPAPSPTGSYGRSAPAGGACGRRCSTRWRRGCRG